MYLAKLELKYINNNCINYTANSKNFKVVVQKSKPLKGLNLDLKL